MSDPSLLPVSAQKLKINLERLIGALSEPYDAGSAERERFFFSDAVGVIEFIRVVAVDLEETAAFHQDYAALYGLFSKLGDSARARSYFMDMLSLCGASDFDLDYHDVDVFLGAWAGDLTPDEVGRLQNWLGRFYSDPAQAEKFAALLRQHGVE